MKKPLIGIIGGSGLYSMPGFEAEQERIIETPWGKPSDSYITGTLAGREVAFLARHGRGHKLSPSELNFRANIFGFKMLGAERIISLSAVGSLKEEHKPLDFVIPDQFFDRTKGRISTFFGDGLVAHVSFADPVCPQLSTLGRERMSNSESQRQARRHVSLYGRPGVLDEGRVQHLSKLGHGRHRHDEPPGSQARSGSRDLLRHRSNGH